MNNASANSGGGARAEAFTSTEIYSEYTGLTRRRSICITLGEMKLTSSLCDVSLFFSLLPSVNSIILYWTRARRRRYRGPRFRRRKRSIVSNLHAEGVEEAFSRALDGEFRFGRERYFPRRTSCFAFIFPVIAVCLQIFIDIDPEVFLPLCSAYDAWKGGWF